MPKTSSVDQYKVPAFQRKRSLSAKARKKQTPRTALERLQAGMAFVKPRKAKSAVKRRALKPKTILNYGRMRRETSSARERDTLMDYFGSKSNSGSGGFSSPLVDGGGYTEPSYERPVYESPSYDDESDYENESAGVEKLASFREMRECGKLDGYFDKIQVAGIKVSSRISVGDRLLFETADGLFEQEITSMQIDRNDIQVAYAGDEIGVKVLAKPSNSGKVFRVI